MQKLEQFKSKDIEYETPDEIFVPLNKEFNFTLDVCATKQNAKCQAFYTKEDDGLNKDWVGVCWMNPPFGKVMQKWVAKAFVESRKNATVVMLIPVRSNTNWWHKYVMQGEIRFIRGEVTFKGHKNGLWQPMCIIVFKNNKDAPQDIKEQNGHIAQQPYGKI